MTDKKIELINQHGDRVDVNYYRSYVNDTGDSLRNPYYNSLHGGFITEEQLKEQSYPNRFITEEQLKDIEFNGDDLAEAVGIHMHLLMSVSEPEGINMCLDDMRIRVYNKAVKRLEKVKEMETWSKDPVPYEEREDEQDKLTVFHR